MFTSQEFITREVYRGYLLCPDTCNILTHASYLVEYMVGETWLRWCNSINRSCIMLFILLFWVLCIRPLFTRGL